MLSENRYMAIESSRVFPIRLTSNPLDHPDQITDDHFPRNRFQSTVLLNILTADDWFMRFGKFYYGSIAFIYRLKFASIQKLLAAIMSGYSLQGKVAGRICTTVVKCVRVSVCGYDDASEGNVAWKIAQFKR